MSILTRFIRTKKTPSAQAGVIVGDSMFAPYSGNAYQNDIYRAAVDAIARNAAKLKGTHVIKTASGRGSGNPVLDRLLQVRPNPYMSAFDMLYRMVTHYYLYNNAFAYLQKNDRGDLTGVFPVRSNSVEWMQDYSGQLYLKFLCDDGKHYTLPYADIIHLRRNYNDNDMFGDPNTALHPALELAHTQNEGIIKGIINGASIRGILKYNQNLANDLIKEARDNFMKDYMQMDNNGGVAALDTKMDYIPLKQDPYNIDDKQQQAVRAKIYSYLGISEKIVDSTYNENEWAAFYESVIEPIAVQLSLEFTDKVFTPREQAFGNSIVFEANRLQFASTTTKGKLIGELMPLGLLTVNQALEILNMPGVEDGDKRIVSLNYVNADKADQYQLEE